MIPSLDFSEFGVTQGPDDAAVPEVPGLSIIRLLARGGEGLVYEARQWSPTRMVAVKVPRSGAGAAERAERLRREAELLANLTHASIVRVHGVVEGRRAGEPVPSVVMELVEGARTLTRHALESGLSERERVELVIDIAGAVQEIHERLHAYHRDLKPGNIIVGRDGKPRVIDLGMAVDGDPAQRLAERGAIAGTIDYMAPEQFERDPAYLTHRTDVYALGVILFELLAGRLPYDLAGLTLAQKEQVIRSQPPLDLDRVCHLEHADLARVVAVALRKERSRRPDEQRWATPAVLAAELRRALDAAEPGPAPDAAAGRRAPAGRSALRRAGAQAAVIAAVSTAIGLRLGEPLAARTGLRDRFERWVFATVPPAVRGKPLRQVAVVGFRSLDEVARVADRLRAGGAEVPPVDPAQPKTWRPLYPALLARLRDAGAAAAVFDVVFRSPGDADELFAAGAKDAGIPVVVGLDLEAAVRPDDPRVNATILNSVVYWGTVGATFTEEQGWWSDLVTRRGTQFSYPALPLAALSAARLPVGEHVYTIAGPGSICIDARVQDPAVTALTRPAAPTLRVASTRTEVADEQSPEDGSAAGLQPGDELATLLLAMPETEQLDRITHGIEQVLDAPPESLCDWLSRRAVFVANLTPTAADAYGYPDGRKLWAVYGHALAYEAMATGDGVRAASESALGAWGLVASLAATFAARAPRRSVVALPAGVLVAFIVATVAVAFSAVVLRSWLLYAPPYAAVTALGVASLTSLMIRLVLPHRHRPSGAVAGGVSTPGARHRAQGDTR